MTPDDVARESWAYWRSLVPQAFHAWALLGNEAGETSFIPMAIGDKGEAYGPFQWHAARIDAMRQAPPKGCGIDVRTASHANQLFAAHWEMTQGEYKRVWPLLVASSSLEAAVTVLVHSYEGSANQQRDIARRVALAKAWQVRLSGQGAGQ